MVEGAGVIDQRAAGLEGGAAAGAGEAAELVVDALVVPLEALAGRELLAAKGAASGVMAHRSPPGDIPLRGGE